MYWVAIGGGAGLSRWAPGTVASLLSWALYAVLSNWLSQPVLLGISAGLWVVGCFCCQITNQLLGVSDHSSIVIDEIVASFFLLSMLGGSVGQQALLILLFRVFDILKPWPINLVDRRFKNGFGVMIDDLLAAFIAGLLFLTLFR